MIGYPVTYTNPKSFTHQTPHNLSCKHISKAIGVLPLAAVVAIVVAPRDNARAVSPRPRTFWVQVGRRLLDWLLVGTRDQRSRETEGSIAWLRKAKAPVKRGANRFGIRKAKAPVRRRGQLPIGLVTQIACATCFG